MSQTHEFNFLKARYITELTGEKASNLESFLAYLKSAEPSSIFYHVYHPLLDSHLVPYEFPNDFSYWFSDTLQDKDLAEQVANIDLPEMGGLESVRKILVARIEKALENGKNYTVRPGNEFNFVNCRYVVFPTGRVAKNIDELGDSIAQESELSIFYHMVTSRLFKGSHYDDFSEWILKNTTDMQLAEAISNIDPTTHQNVRSIQKELLGIVQRYLREKRLARI
ncbi:MAG: DUF5752 family protein [Nitrososphaerales archaeon]